MNVRRNAHAMARDVIRALPFARRNASYPEIADLAIIGDRHTAAIVDRDATIVWYCPGRFDAPSLIGGLLDPALAGSWFVDLRGARPDGRRYLGSGAILETRLRHPEGQFTVTDWMNLGQNDIPHGILCRTLTEAPARLRIVLKPRPDNGACIPRLRRGTPSGVVIDDRFHLQASHPATIREGQIEIAVPKGERSWAILADGAVATPMASPQAIEEWRAATLSRWQSLTGRSRYDGPWADQVEASLRTLHLLVYEPTGAIAAAATNGLPEIVGGGRNYDYRYSWLRDSGLIVRGLLRFERDVETSRRHLGVFASLVGAGHREFLDPVWTVGGERVPMPQRLPLAGYRGSRPVLLGNAAADQLQIGSLADLLLGMKEVYERGEPMFQWDVVTQAIEFMIRNWDRPDHGIWEEKPAQKFTASRVFAVCAIEGLARFAADSGRRERWCDAARTMRAAIEQRCRTADGAYAAAEGTAGVDISAALFPVWGYCRPDSPAIEATIREIERRYSPREGLFHRHLEKASTERREGCFLAGTFWMANYWVARGDLDRARRLIDAGAGYANDLGLFSEEIDDRTGKALGNTPLGLVHGSFLSAVGDYADTLQARQPATTAADAPAS